MCSMSSGAITLSLAQEQRNRKNTFGRVGEPPQTVSKAEPQDSILHSSYKRKAL